MYIRLVLTYAGLFWGSHIMRSNWTKIKVRQKKALTTSQLSPSHYVTNQTYLNLVQYSIIREHIFRNVIMT